MFKALVRAIDGLFYETTVITHRTIKRVYSNPQTLTEIRKYCLDNNIEMIKSASDNTSSACVRCESTIVATEDMFMLGDKLIAIPENIRNMVPFDQVDALHYHDFPIDKSKPILVMSEEPDYRFTAQYGAEKGTPAALLFDHIKRRDIIETLLDKSGNDDAAVAMSQWQETHMTSVIYTDWDLLVIKLPQGQRVSIAVPNTRAEHDYVTDTALSVTTACIFARAFLLTLRKTGRDTSQYNEHDLRSVILALLVADRSIVD